MLLLFATSPQLLSIDRPQGLAGLASLRSISSSVHRPLCQKLQKLHHALAEWSTILHIESRLSGLLDTAGALGGTGLEAVGELAGDGLQVLHAAGTGGLSPLGLLAPVVCGGMLVLVLEGVLLQSKRCDVGRRFRYRWAGGGGRCATYTS
jgi:hypothetical protein